MHINGPGQQRGHVLLIAGDASVRRRTVQLAPSANLAALAMVPASMLLGSELPSDTVYLDGARDPNTVLARLRTAAATPGPLLLYLSGRLTVDRRGRRLHLALAGTTSATVRYTALPWDWLGSELRERPAGLTTVLLDLAADKDAWPLLREYGSLPAPACAEVYGVVRPPAFATGDGAVSGYTRQWIDQLRHSPVRPANVQLHALAAGTAALPPGALVLPTARELALRPAPHQEQHQEQRQQQQAWQELPRPHPQQPVPGSAVSSAPDSTPTAAAAPAPGRDPRPHIHALASAGRHPEAAALARAWEEHVLHTCGHTSVEAIEWAEIRADLARMAGDFATATRLWLGAGQARLTREGAEDPHLQAAAAGALYCWTQLKDRAPALESGPELLRLLSALPALDPRYLALTRARLETLASPQHPRALHN
ncbi:hypothetical protein ABZY44_17955 [Streptomyces sp. NPDC006544]|uniref:hypothetical protein n=1 Tax=Streptomyces sp. NPDC006544 TaxID=3154583 RepID=UPI0033B04269